MEDIYIFMIFDLQAAVKCGESGRQDGEEKKS